MSTPAPRWGELLEHPVLEQTRPAIERRRPRVGRREEGGCMRLARLPAQLVFIAAVGSASAIAVSSNVHRAPLDARGRTAANTARPVHTFSIVARDAKTGEMGVAVQSHYFSVGPVVAWAEAGVGAVATQSLVEISYGPRGLDLMRQGKSASDALPDLIAKDAQRDVRQVAMVD